MGKQGKGGAAGSVKNSKAGEWTERVDPAAVRFTHSKIRPVRALPAASLNAAPPLLDHTHARYGINHPPACVSHPPRYL
jgi:hypothetical protein